MDAEPTLRPADEQMELLDPFERRSFELVDFVNSNPYTKAVTASFLRTVGMGWVYYSTRNLVHLVGFDKLAELRPERGMIVASNHRSFFDLYVIACWLYRHSDLLQRTYFPVRSTFFYEQPSGVAVNLAMAALTMYPPVFRDPKKRAFNTYGLKRLTQLLQQPGTVVGMHPEGTRNKGDDPYQLLPAQPGIGRLIMRAKPTVLPIFINGLGNDLPRQIWGNFAKSGSPIVIVAGDPIDLDAYYRGRNTLRVQKQVADHVLEAIRKLGETERRVRADLARR